jgi:hypothetical protein
MRPRLGSVNLALLSLYFFPLWGREAFRALVSPYHGLEERNYAAVALHIGHFFDFGLRGLAMTVHVLAGIKLVIAAAFAAYLIEFVRAWTVKREIDGETVDAVLILAVIGIIVSAVTALAVGDAVSVHLAATQTLLVAGAITVIVVERQIAERRKPAQPVVASGAEAVRPLPIGNVVAGSPPAPAAVALARIPENSPAPR